jgi:CDP-diacylglycerol--glycerol-3-phosphate 3-phosphatidyltransferase
VTIYDLKPAFQNLLRPLCRALASAGVTANQVTLAALLGSIAVGGLFAINPGARWAALMIPVWLFLRMADMQSRLGAVLNELGDVVSDAVLYLPFAAVPGLWPWLIVAIVLLGVLTEMTGVVAVQIGAGRRYDGPMGKSDRAFVFGLLGVLLGIGLQPAAWMNFILLVVAGLAALTVYRRAAGALRENPA